MKRIALLLGLVLSISVANAQNYVFSVLANKGTNQIQQGTAWDALKSGTKIYTGNKIKITSGGYAGLMHKSGKTIELKAAGEYSIAQLESKLQSNSSSYAQKYAKFAMNNSGSDYSKYKYNVTGSVERAIVGSYSFMSVDEIKMVPGIPMTINWKSDKPESEEIEVRVITLFGETIFSKKTSTNHALIDLNGIELSEPIYIINLYDPETDENVIEKGIRVTIDNSDEAKTLKKEFEGINKEIDPKSPMDQLILGAFFADKKYTNYAASSFFNATILAPEVEDFKGTYYEYLTKQGIVTKEEKAEKE